MNPKNEFKIIIASVIIPVLVSCVSTPTQAPIGTNSNPTVFPSSTSTTNYDIRMNSGQVLLDFALSPDGAYLAIFTNKDVYMYDIATRNKTTIIHFENNDYSYYGGAVAFSPDGTKIAVSGKFVDQPVNLWDAGSKQWVGQIFNIPNGYYVNEIEFSPNSTRIMIRNIYPASFHCEGPEDKLVLYNITDLENWRESYIYDVDICSIVPAKFRFVDGGKLFLWTEASPIYSLYFIDTSTGQVISHDKYGATLDQPFYAISANGQIAATIDSQRKTTLINIETKEVLVTLENTVILLKDEKQFLAHNYQTNIWSFWDNGTVKCEYGEIQMFDNKISIDGNVFSVFNSSNKELQVWDIPNCKLIDTLLFDG